VNGCARPHARLRGLLIGSVIVITLAGLPAEAQRLQTADEVLDAMQANSGLIEDLDATITIQTYKDSEVSLIQRMRLALLQPDKMRQEYLEPDYLAGNITLIVGDAMWIYLAVVDQWLSKDLSELSPAEQPWLLFRQILHNVEDELDNYAFALLEDESDAYHLRGAATNDDAAYGVIELWVDPETLIPRRRQLFDVDAKLLVAARILDVEKIDGVAYLAQRIEAYDAGGILKNVIVYDTVAMNRGADSALFEIPTLEKETDD